MEKTDKETKKTIYIDGTSQFIGVDQMLVMLECIKDSSKSTKVADLVNTFKKGIQDKSLLLSPWVSIPMNAANEFWDTVSPGLKIIAYIPADKTGMINSVKTGVAEFTSYIPHCSFAADPKALYSWTMKDKDSIGEPKIIIAYMNFPELPKIESIPVKL